LENIAIELKNVSKSFNLKKNERSNIINGFKNKNKFLALENISFKVPKGKMYSIIGLNGSGKTTLLRVIAGIYKQDSGTVATSGKLSPILNVKNAGLHDENAAKDNIVTSGIILGIEKRLISKKIDKIIQFADLEKFTNLKLKHYSSGMRARLACSIALETNPDILLLDELLSAGDIKFRKKSYEAFLRLVNEGKTILFTTNSLSMSAELSDKTILINAGRLIMVGEPDKVIEKFKEIAGNTK